MRLKRPIPNAPAIAATSEIPPGTYPQDDWASLHHVVLMRALEEWGIEPSVVDGLLITPGMVTSSGFDLFAHERFIDELGIRPRFALTMNLGGASYTAMVIHAARAIADGLADAVLCIGAGKFPKVGEGGGDSMAKDISHPDFEYPYGSFIPALYALAATRHMYDRGTTPEDLAAVAVSSRAWALQHPDALMGNRGPLSIDDVLSSRLIAEPFHLLDCSVPCEGGGVVLVTREEVARELSDQPAFVLGFGEYHDHGIVSHSSDFSTMGVGRAARPAFEMAGLTPRDVDVAELYDAFTINPILLLEETGIAEPGDGGRWFHDGRTAPGGDLPVNTYGGLLSFGHTGGASGLSMLVEGARQVMGLADRRQVDAEVALIQTYGGMMADHTTLILGRTP